MVWSRFLLIAAIFSAASFSAVGATNAFIKIDGVPGESDDAMHKGEIEVLSWSWGATQTSSVRDGIATGRRQYQPLLIRKQIDKSSPQLAKRCASGTHIKEAKITMRRSGATGEFEDYLEIVLTDVYISSVQMSCCDNDCDGAAEREPYEELSMTYGKIKVTHLRSGESYEDIWSPRSN